jgi:hypothetical protein
MFTGARRDGLDMWKAVLLKRDAVLEQQQINKLRGP